MSKFKEEIDDEFHDALNANADRNSSESSIPENESDERLKNEDNLIPRTENLKVENDSSDDEEYQDLPKDVEFSVEEMKENEEHLTAEQLELKKKEAEEIKAKANDLFKNGMAEKAIELYTDALNIMPLANTKERAILYANRAAAKIQLGSKKSAISDCDKSLDLWPGYVRCLLRRAKLHEGEDNLDEALADFKCVNEIDPGQKDALEAMVRLAPLIEEKNERLKTEVVGKLKDLGNMILKPFGLSTSNFQMVKDPNTGGYSINMKN